MKFDKVYKLKNYLTKNEFIRKILMEISKPETNTTTFKKSLNEVDLRKIEFSDVEENYIECIECISHVDIDVDASIGYNNEIEEKYSGYTPLLNQKYITSWMPHSFHCVSNEKGYSYNNNFIEKNTYRIDDFLEEYIMNISERNLIDVNDINIEVDSDGYDEAKISAVYKAIENCAPGDKIKDISFEGNVDIKSLNCYLLPYYKVTYKYEGVEYNASGYALDFKKHNWNAFNYDKELYNAMICDFDYNNFKYDKINTKNTLSFSTNKEHKEKNKLSKMINIIKWISIVIIVIIVCTVFALYSYIYTPISLALIGFGIYDSIKRNKKNQSALDETKNNEIETRIDIINVSLIKNGCEPLNESEKNDIKDKMMTILKYKQ